MNYIQEINGFHKRNIFEPLSSSAVSLWFSLMHFHNLCGWKKQFSVAASQLQAQSGLKNTSFKSARRELQEKGRIIVTPRGSNRAAIYEMISQATDSDQNPGTGTPSHTPPQKSESSDKATLRKNQPTPKPNKPTYNKADDSSGHIHDNSPDHSSDHKSDHKSDHTPAPFFKQNEIENKKENKTAADIFFAKHFTNLTPHLAQELQDWTNATNEALVLHAMKKAVEQNKATWRYVRGILKAWKKKGITTIGAANQEKMHFSNQRTSFPAKEKSKIVPDWFYEQKKKRKSPQSQPNILLNNPKKEKEELKALLATVTGVGK
ncbi:DnaD domain-containing protein [Oceanobacillus kapialis]|uniref:DnaD domain-containing protein n=1 Tax=Oceanobacillus kapialis TaxID=481353 RepID=UPI00384D7B8A